LLLYLIVVAWLLVIGFGRIVQVTAEPWHSVAVLGLKLLMFVIIPGAMVWLVGGYHLGEPSLLSIQPRALQPALWIAFAVLIMQSFLGRGLQDIRAAHLPIWVIAIATPLSFLWLMLEVGLVEEFFFRVLKASASSRHTPTSTA
jgi:hypothetical protein